ncbi:MAG: hypothetical protein ACLFRD_08840, partial [Nitriliruptoraceae bacterium]
MDTGAGDADTGGPTAAPRRRPGLRGLLRVIAFQRSRGQLFRAPGTILGLAAAVGLATGLFAVALIEL